MVKTKALISFAVTAKLICAFVFAEVKIWFSHVAHKSDIGTILHLKDLWHEQCETSNSDQLRMVMEIINKTHVMSFGIELMRNWYSAGH